MGNVLGVNAEDLQDVGFPPGRAELSDQEIIKLERLARALDLRPGLRLEIHGHSDSKVDRLKLAEDRLMTAVQDRKQKERRNVSTQSSLFAESDGWNYRAVNANSVFTTSTLPETATPLSTRKTRSSETPPSLTMKSRIRLARS